MFRKLTPPTTQEEAKDALFASIWGGTVRQVVALRIFILAGFFALIGIGAALIQHAQDIPPHYINDGGYLTYADASYVALKHMDVNAFCSRVFSSLYSYEGASDYKIEGVQAFVTQNIYTRYAEEHTNLGRHNATRTVSRVSKADVSGTTPRGLSVVVTMDRTQVRSGNVSADSILVQATIAIGKRHPKNPWGLVLVHVENVAVNGKDVKTLGL